MAYDSSRGRTVLFGGFSPTVDAFADTWEWDGENWTQMADSGPPGRAYTAMAYDAQRNQTVLFGGTNAKADTWGWDGRNWTQLADSGAWPRVSFGMVYDSKRQRIVIFGGNPAAGAPNPVGADTWEWNGAAWTQSAVTGPATRNSHMMAYDSTRNVTVLFGGIGQGNIWLGDTWEWNGSEWTQVSHFGATPCLAAALAFKGDSVALFGGQNFATPTPQYYGSTWTWNGRNWTLRQDFGPSPRSGHNMCYDSKRSTLVLFGGAIGSSTTVGADTWEHSEGP
jgi:hypothetical protein